MKRQLQSKTLSSSSSSPSSTQPPSHHSLSCDYHDQFRIEEISTREYGNPLIARGAFGEVSIAVQLPTVTTATETETETETETATKCHQCRYVAIKTIRNAVTYNNEKSSYEFTPTVFTELASLRALSRSSRPHPNILQLLCTKYDTSKKKDEDENGDSAGASTSVSASAIGGNSLFSSTTLSFVFPYCPCDLQDIISHRRYNYNRNNTSSNKNAHVNVSASADANDNHNQYHKKIFTKPFMKCIMRDICHGLEYCHSQGIIHCDIKPGNIVLSSNGVFQLADFGIARLYNKRDQIIKSPTSTSTSTSTDPGHNHNHNHNATLKNDHKGLCTLYYRSPELLYGSTTYGPSMDMWGVGLILTELCTLRPLFPGGTVLDQLSKIMDVLGTPTEKSWPKAKELPDYHKVKFDCREGVGLREVVPHLADIGRGRGTGTGSQSEEKFQLAHMVESLVVMDPEKRLTAAQCLVHPWMVHWGNYCDGRGDGSNDSNDSGGVASDSLDSFFGLTNIDDCDGVGGPPTSRRFMIENMVFNNEVLGDDILINSWRSNTVGGSALEDNGEELLDQIKLKGVAMAEARRNLSSEKNGFHLSQMTAFCEENDNEGNVNDTSLQPPPPSDKAGLAILLATKMRENNFIDVKKER